MAAQFIPPPPVGTPHAPQPAGPRGLYREFGMPEQPVRIHFPREGVNVSNPWYWWLNIQQPQYFSYLGGVWGNGWTRQPFASVIKILAVDTQPFVPVPFVGFGSLETAVRFGNPDQNFGRFRFADNFFWDVIARDPADGKNPTGPRAKPKFNIVKGRPTQRTNSKQKPIGTIIAEAVKLWAADWNANAAAYNLVASQVDPTAGFHTGAPPIQTTFSVPLPQGPPAEVAAFTQELVQRRAYINAVPASAFFQFNTFTTQAYAFTLNIGQLNDRKWNMAVFPPLDATEIFNGVSSFVSKDYGGYGGTTFLVAGPAIV